VIAHIDITQNNHPNVVPKRWKLERTQCPLTVTDHTWCHPFDINNHCQIAIRRNIARTLSALWEMENHMFLRCVTPQYILYIHMHCTYYTVSPSCTVHSIHTVYCTYYVQSQFPMLGLHLQHMFTLAQALVHTSPLWSLCLTIRVFGWYRVWVLKIVN
jgi:hypothetical protein